MTTARTFIYKGEIVSREWQEFPALFIGDSDKPLAEQIENDLTESLRTKARYFVSPIPFESLDQAVEGYLKTVFGVADIDSHIVCGDISGPYAYVQAVRFGGHDIIGELERHEGQFALIEITQEPQP